VFIYAMHNMLRIRITAPPLLPVQRGCIARHTIALVSKSVGKVMPHTCAQGKSTVSNVIRGLVK
jgi:hypothetical protein